MWKWFVKNSTYLENCSSTGNSTSPIKSSNSFKIVLILDESGSMEGVKDKMIESINSFLKEQKQEKGRETTFTLVKFNSTCRRIIENRALNEVDQITSRDYNPEGSTALYDAIGDTINWFRYESDVLMVIVTDGQENASKTYTKHSISDMIEEKKKHRNWTYVYLSNDLNTASQGNGIGCTTSNYASNIMVDQKHFGEFISQDLSRAVKNCRQTGQSVQSQLYHHM